MKTLSPALCRPVRHVQRSRRWSPRAGAWSLLPLARRGRLTDDGGMATAEYAIATLAACGFAGLLLALMRSDEVRGLLFEVIRRALSLN